MSSKAASTQVVSGGAPALIWRQHVVVKATGLSPTTLWRYEQRGDFPQRVRLGPNAVGWRASEVQAWIDGLATVASEDPAAA